MIASLPIKMPTMLQMQLTVCPSKSHLCGQSCMVSCALATGRCRKEKLQKKAVPYSPKVMPAKGSKSLLKQRPAPVSHKELRHCRNNQGAVCNTFERISALALALGPRCHGDGLCPQHPTVWEFLQSARR